MATQSFLHWLPTTTLKHRMTTRIRAIEIQHNIKEFYMFSDRSDLILAEAIFIRSESPTVTNQREGETQLKKNSDAITVTILKSVAWDLFS